MVCSRCIMVVDNELNKLGVQAEQIKLGEATFKEELKPEEVIKIQSALIPLGFDLIDDKKSRLIEQIKNIIIDVVHYNNEELK